MADPTETDGFASDRANMVSTQLRARGVRDEHVLAAMAKVPRHEFVVPEYRRLAYEDHPVPIAKEQTISQPFIVALMLEALALRGDEIILEVGTGSGYQTALLAELARYVYSIERHEELAGTATATLRRLGYENLTVIVGDGSEGLPDRAPFDAIIVLAAAPRIPQSLFEQLREGGRMVMPVGPAQAQELILVGKRQNKPVTKVLEGCRFVPLIGLQAYSEGW